MMHNPPAIQGMAPARLEYHLSDLHARLLNVEVLLTHLEVQHATGGPVAWNELRAAIERAAAHAHGLLGEVRA